jgi:hypothetical protein
VLYSRMKSAIFKNKAQTVHYTRGTGRYGFLSSCSQLTTASIYLLLALSA